MDKNLFPFSNLTEAERDAILSRARDERAKAIANAFRLLGRLLAAPFRRQVFASGATAIPTPVPHRAVR